MPPNNSSGTILDRFECSYKQAANPYSETKHTCCEECPGPSGSRGTRGHEAAEPEVEDTVRVTTRARLTYELYNYSKNAMLIVHSTYNTFESDIKIEELKTTFEKFRFEVDVVAIALDNEELYEKCRQFFQRDFTDYGAVALVILCGLGVGQTPVKGFERKFFLESVIVDNFKVARNSSLANKPKIYITEVGRGGFGLLDHHLHRLRIDHATHGDVIGFHSRARDAVVVRLKLDEEQSRRAAETGPLMRFCKILASMGDNATLTEIIARTKNYDFHYFKDFIRAKRFLTDRIGVVNTLRKELYFSRVEEN